MDIKKETKKPKRITSGMKNKQDRETVGKIALDLRSSYQANDLAEVSDIGANSTKSTMEEIWIAVDRGRKDTSITGSFYVVISQKKERILSNVIRQLFYYRQSCPTPTYLTSVFFYNRTDDELFYLWSLPSKDRCFYMYQNKEFVPPEEYQLLGFVIDFIEGKLDKMAQKLNKEEIVDPLSIVF